MRYPIDLLSVGLVLTVFSAQIAALVLDWPWYTLIPIVIGLRYVSLVEHNHSHVGIFRWDFLNELFGWLCFTSNGIPLEFYREHHVRNHHQYSQRFDSQATDWSSTFGFEGTRFPDVPVSKLYYVLTFPILTIATSVISLLRAPGSLALKRFVVSFIVVSMAAGYLIWINPLGFLLFFVLSWTIVTLGHGFNNYDHHAGCTMEDDYNSANESLSLFDRKLGFNIGYHIEHHMKPGLHWSQLPVYHEEIRPQIGEERYQNGFING